MKKLLGMGIIALLVCLLTVGCGSGGQKRSEQAERLISMAYKARDYQRLMKLADSLDVRGELSHAEAYYWRGYACDRMKKLRLAEFYWKTSVDAASKSDDPVDLEYYVKSACRLANLLSVRGDYQAALKMAQPVASRLEELKCDTTSDYVNLLIYIGCCQSTSEGFERAYQKHLDNIASHRGDAAYKDAFAGLLTIAFYCNYTEKYQEALKWVDHFGELLAQYEQLPGATREYIDKQLGRFDIYRATALEGLGKKQEAARVFEAFQETMFSKTPEGHIVANDYLIAAGRWDEAADNYTSLDAMLAEQEDGFTLDNIRKLALKKYHANLSAGRRDSAMAVSLQICDSLNGAFASAAKIDAEEQATIVGSVEQMAAQQAEAASRRQYYQVAALLGVFFFFCGITVWRRQKARQQAEAYEQLREAYTKIEESTAEKVSQDTTLDMARKVQRRVLIQQLPRHENLSLYASMMPAAGVGSDVYDLIVRDEKLFWMVGEAQGGDIDRMSMMASVRAQFRTAAVLDDQADRIVGALNLALTDGCQKGGAFALFVGVLDLASGHLSYCRAGGERPVLVGSEISQLPGDAGDPVGLLTDAVFTVGQTDIAHGTLIYLYTSGLTQAENADGKAYGERRLLGEVLQASKMHPSTKPFAESIQAAVQRFVGDTPLKHDITTLAIRYV